jgi:hypothetical protein
MSQAFPHDERRTNTGPRAVANLATGTTGFTTQLIINQRPIATAPGSVFVNPKLDVQPSQLLVYASMQLLCSESA